MAKAGKRAPTPQREAPSFLAKSKEFLQEAEVALEAGRLDAAMLSAIHAAITAADAATVILAGTRSTDPDHARAADLLEETGRGAQEVKTHADQLRRLVSKKNAVEYESRRARRADAVDALKRARRIVNWADQVVSAARS